jgi:cytochrome c oxidase cbb3-type subunit III
VSEATTKPDKGRSFPVTLSPCHLVTLSLLVGGCDLPGRPNPADRPVPQDQITQFDPLYAMHCSGCHGADGNLGPAPPLNDPLFLAIVPEAELVRVITEGRAVTPTQKSLMPAFRLGKGAPMAPAQDKVWAELKAENHIDPKQQNPLTTTQVQVLAEGIKKRWGPAKPAAGPVPPYLAPTKGGGDTKEGRRVFADACAGCHGSQGQGSKDGERPIGAINNKAFLALTSDQALRRYVITGRPDLGMPPFDGTDGRSVDFKPLTSAEIDDLVALLAFWRLGGPANGK